MVCNEQKWSNCLFKNGLSYHKKFFYNTNGHVAFGEMKYSNKNGLYNSELCSHPC